MKQDYTMVFRILMIGLLIIICSLMPKSSNIYVLNPHTSLSCNVYTSSSLDIIDHSRHVLDLGIYMSSDCSFEFHITNLNKRTTHLTGWILQTFCSRDKSTMLILFKGLMRSKNTSGYFSFYVDNISLKTYSTWNFSKILTKSY